MFVVVSYISYTSSSSLLCARAKNSLFIFRILTRIQFAYRKKLIEKH